MFDKNKHKIILVQILKEIYSHKELRNLLGFKGGTAIFLFYNLPRFSVDLDFDLLNAEKKELTFQQTKTILSSFGEIKEVQDKKSTLFFLLNYQKGERNIKIEISKRKTSADFEVKSYLGIPVLLMTRENLAASKLSALLTRKKFAARDLFDLWFILKNNWKINDKVVNERLNLSLKSALEKAVEKIESVKKNQLLQGMGELLDVKQKIWVKEKLKEELIFLLKLYQESMLL